MTAQSGGLNQIKAQEKSGRYDSLIELPLQNQKYWLQHNYRTINQQKINTDRNTNKNKKKWEAIQIQSVLKRFVTRVRSGQDKIRRPPDETFGHSSQRQTVQKHTFKQEAASRWSTEAPAVTESSKAPTPPNPIRDNNRRISQCPHNVV